MSTAAYDVPDYMLDDSRQDEEPTPAEMFAEGDFNMTDSLMRWCRQEENEDYMLDIFAHRDSNGCRDEAIKVWSKQVESGDWE